MFLLDTNVASDLFRARETTSRHRFNEARRTSSTIAISVLTEAELLFGFQQRPEANRLRTSYDLFSAEISILPWTSTASRSYAVVRHYLQNRGLALSTMDLLIAAHAHSNGATLVTRDRAFRHIADIVEVVNWATG